MKRIDSINARPDVNGTGKKGFHDNADLAGQDATYLSPDWLNAIQEELANLLERNGKVLDPNNNAQLYDLLATEEGLLALSAAVEDRLQQLKQQQETSDDALQTQLYDAIESLQQQISNLSNGLASLYPKVILAGVIKPGQTWEIKKPAGSNISFLDTRYAVQITPEGGHEAWSISRQDAKIDVNVWNRSGTNRIGYSGNINWSVVQTEGLTSSAGNGDYVYTGTPVVFPILAGESKSFLLIGAGGGGGSSRYEDLVANSNPPVLKGIDGEATYLSIDGTNIIFTAGGGKAGAGGVDGGNGQYINGVAGDGGQWSISGEYTSATRTNGQGGNATSANHTGAATDSNGRGAGGNGADGYLIATQGFGGGAGEGSRISIIYTNNTANTQYARLYIGQAGKGEQSLLTTDEAGNIVTPANYIAGTNGSNGFARVSSAV
ncbi:hypothetical protein [Acinetobacter tandoii]|uniref:Uncharacterized protein n=1 Tax=Acinetobacter tandoii DSM 14970 = CIP 107469 TaxID=1120927 RepID=R9B4K3_9GAMM|nr:hypothetical protein [Acinetobacter tandoii]EOR07291.1 hypothetical protein I593_02178 [Acinetobacter tandoii DSM 14970 = CIP 107469]